MKPKKQISSGPGFEDSKMGEAFQDEFLKLQPAVREFFHLFEYLPLSYFFAKDANHRYVYANGQILTDIFGLDSLDELTGKTDADFQPSILAEAYHAEDRRVMEGGVTIPNRAWLVPHVLGIPKWYVSTKSPIRDPSGQVIGLAGVMFRMEAPADRERYFKELAPVVARIEERYAEEVSMSDLAESINLSSTQFNVKFRELLHMSPTEYLQTMRIETSRKLLLQSERSIAEIGAEVGFYDQSHFTKRFRKVTGMTPHAYRLHFR